jgi:acetyl-CoA C-acetyltransferase
MKPSSPKAGYEHVLLRRDGQVLEVTINRPGVRNALHPPANDELAQAFDAYFADPTLRVAIIAGAGGVAFCAGNDLVHSASGRQMTLPPTGIAGLTSRKAMTKPVIAAVNGYALGGGFEVALACHVIVADDAAQFALTEVRVGLVAGAGGIVRLPRKIPCNVANELILTGRRMPAREAQSLGLVNQVTRPGEALEGARALAAEILEGSPTSISESLRILAETENIASLETALDRSIASAYEVLASENATEGMLAFAQKRKPVWRPS